MNVQKNRQRRINLYKLSKGCERCGYNRHPSALCFDHLPDQEKSEVTKNGYSKKPTAGGMFKLYSKQHPIKELMNEIRKCRILCSNCHMEQTHDGHAPGPKKMRCLFWRRMYYKLTKFMRGK